MDRSCRSSPLGACPSNRSSRFEGASATRCGMSKTFRDWEPDQVWLLPPSLQDLVPTGHVAHFVRDTVRNGLDLETILASYGEERGFPPYHPGMMVALLLYGYSQGVYSSRRIARGCEERLDFAAVTAMQRPDFRTITILNAVLAITRTGS